MRYKNSYLNIKIFTNRKSKITEVPIYRIYITNSEQLNKDTSSLPVRIKIVKVIQHTVNMVVQYNFWLVRF